MGEGRKAGQHRIGQRLLWVVDVEKTEETLHSLPPKSWVFAHPRNEQGHKKCHCLLDHIEKGSQLDRKGSAPVEGPNGTLS
ncbi:hypothetical protein D9M68_429020 [compost metagenome]